jgi:transcriptional regulator with XRE-family HTH domain
LREEKGLTQWKLAEELYISPSSLSYLESGKGDPKGDIIIQMAEYFGVTADYLLGISDCRTSQAVSEITGLTDDSINALKELAADGAKKDLEMINKVIMLFFGVRKEKRQ